MGKSRTLMVAFAASFLAMVGLLRTATLKYQDPFPPLAVSLSSPVTHMSDFLGISLGFRKLAGDIAWIQTILYYGTPEEIGDPEEIENGGGRYPLFLSYCQRAGRIDPNFKYIYYYCGASLGWNLNRLDEAEEFLKEGIQANPKEWRFQQYLAGLAYQKNHNINKLTEFLEGFVQEEDCPNLLRALLANIYQKQKRYKDSIRVWMIVYRTQDPLYIDRAVAKLREMGPYAH